MRGTLTGIWAAIPTPFRADGGLDLDGIGRNTRHYADGLGLTGVFCNGLMGEIWSLTAEERRLVLETIVDQGGGRLEAGVVTSHHSLAETIALSRHARDVGAHHIVLLHPAGPFDDESLIRHVVAVADAVDISIMLFDAPAPLGGFGPQVVDSLLAQAPIIGVKCTRGSADVLALRARFGARISICDPLEEHWLANVVDHGQPALYADPEPYLYQPAGVRPIHDYTARLWAGDTEGARAMAKSLTPLRRVYNRWIMDPLLRGHAPNAALKHWSTLTGLTGGVVRPPLRPLTAAEAARLERDLADARAVDGRTGWRS